MATNFVAKLLIPPALIALLFGNGLEYRYLNERINSVNDASTLCLKNDTDVAHYNFNAQ